MQLCKEFIIKDIKAYSINNDISIIDELEQCNLFVVIEVVVKNRINLKEKYND